ncbi:RNA polymerase sigma factor [Streptomyces albipurpureus]|uniref:Sigma-70 family RNA polymerase sigma factor n=1 Tax=Streptomyces albipurpureus TaxID=2897419 RepID=A0ABT0UNM0_9ACTN|nr:sigma-70 family RNA polymerase sigma factor [Streptomyces sp. CWNU-1]MCM2389926.1 sigma-70 family RNA polymerase sigma factor [Streptomyces sp. CWNU-1]
MTDQPRHVPRFVPRSRTVTFGAFHEYHRKLWMRYAHVQVGSREAAERVVHKAFAQLRSTWDYALCQESVHSYAWTLLKEQVDTWLYERGLEPQLAEAAGFERAIRRLLIDELLDGFVVLAEEIGLYSAISELPERQQDVIVLRYVLACTDEKTADFLGIETSTVRSNIRHARAALASKLNIPLNGKR